MSNKANPFQAGNVYRRTYKNEVQEVTILGVTGGKTPTVIYLSDKGAMRTRKQELFVEEFRLFGFNANVGIGVSVVEGRIDGTKFTEYLTWEERVKAAAEADIPEEDEDAARLTPSFSDAQGQTAILAQQQLNTERLEQALVSASVSIDTLTGYHRLTILLAGMTMLEAQDMFSPLILGSITGLRYPYGIEYEIDSLEAITPMVADATYLTVHLRTRTQSPGYVNQRFVDAALFGDLAGEPLKVDPGSAAEIREAINGEQSEQEPNESWGVPAQTLEAVTGERGQTEHATPVDELGYVATKVTEDAPAPDSAEGREPTLRTELATPYGQTAQTVVVDDLA